MSSRVGDHCVQVALSFLYALIFTQIECEGKSNAHVQDGEKWEQALHVTHVGAGTGISGML